MPLKIHNNLLNADKPEDQSTYTLAADTCESHPKANVVFSNIKASDIMVAFNVAKSAFRQIEITNETTGEIMVTFYMSDEFHAPSRTYGDVINYLTKFCYNT